MRIHQKLHKLLYELATPLLDAGITPKQFGDIAARAFVRAACKAATLRNGRVNQSRVAVLTGLSRVEVRKALLGTLAEASTQLPRTLRVVAGWQNDRRYTDARGRPKELEVRGSQCSFTTLSSNYAGDVPYRAVLDELRRLKVVREANGRVKLTNNNGLPSPATLRFLSSLLPLVADSVASLANDTKDTRPTIQHLTLKAKDSQDLRVMRDRALMGATSFLSGLDRSLKSPAASRRTRRNKPGRKIKISILVSEQ